MRVLKINRYDYKLNIGGDVVQMQSIGECLGDAGVEVRYASSQSEIEKNLPWCDIAHIYNSQRSSETLAQALLCRKHKKPIVLSPIIADFSEVNSKGRSKLRAFLEKYLGRRMNLIKDLARIKSGLQELYTIKRSLFKSHEANLIQLGTLADRVIPNSRSEAKFLIEKLRFPEKKIQIIANGVSQHLLDKGRVERGALDKHNICWEKFALCVSRIDERKNILNLVQALKNTEINLVLVGGVSPLHKKYFSKVQDEIAKAKNIVHVQGPFTHDELVDFYSKSHVHILPSWLETPGLVSLEAGLFGNNLVVGDCPPVREYFDQIALFCQPDDLSSIYEASIMAYTAERDFLKAKQSIVKNYTWGSIANDYGNVYKEIVGKC